MVYSCYFHQPTDYLSQSPRRGANSLTASRIDEDDFPEQKRTLLYDEYSQPTSDFKAYDALQSYPENGFLFHQTTGVQASKLWQDSQGIQICYCTMRKKHTSNLLHRLDTILHLDPLYCCTSTAILTVSRWFWSVVCAGYIPAMSTPIY